MTRRTRPRADPRRALFAADLSALTPDEQQRAALHARMRAREVAGRRAQAALLGPLVSAVLLALVLAACIIIIGGLL